MRLNLGSGQRPFGVGWTNIDSQSKWTPDIVADATDLSVFKDESAEYICLHHVLEHFSQDVTVRALRECWRVLAPGGSLLVFVPDNRKVTKAYLDGYFEGGLECNEDLFNTNTYGAYMGDEADRHKWSYSYTSLSTLLNCAGVWKSVRRFDWRPIEGADIARDDRWILGVEGVK